MMERESFILDSIELNLFFLRIMKEHLIFIEADLSQRDMHLSPKIAALRNEATKLLKITTSLADTIGIPSIGSGEYITKFTLDAEKATEFYTGISIDKSITMAQLNLNSQDGFNANSALVERVAALNSNAISAAHMASDFVSSLLQEILNCRTFVHSYPLLLDHVNRETQFYLKELQEIQNRIPYNLARETVEHESFWNRIMGDHSKFVRGLLDPTEEELFKKANFFGQVFDQLTAQAISLNENVNDLNQVTEDSRTATTSIRDFKRTGVEGILECKIKIVALPLLADHILREANHYLRMLNYFQDRLQIN